MDNETAWNIFGWSLLALGWLNFWDTLKSVAMFLMALIIFISLKFGGERKC